MVLLVAVVVLLIPFPVKSLWWREAFNSGHAVLFAFLSFVIYRQIKAATRFENSLTIYVFVLFAGMLFGILIELLQTLVMREASLHDLYGDLLGLLAGLCLIAAQNLKAVQYKQLVVVFYLVASSGFMLLAMSPLIQLSWYYQQRHNAFPVIVDFDASWISRFVRFENVDILKHLSLGRDKPLHVVRFNRGKYPGISVFEPEPDWSSYHSLRMDIFSEYESKVVLVLRIHDNKHNQEFSDRFNMKLTIRPGRNEIGVPLDQVAHGPVSRELDLTNIAGIILFVSKLDAPIELEVSPIFLE